MGQGLSPGLRQRKGDGSSRAWAPGRRAPGLPSGPGTVAAPRGTWKGGARPHPPPQPTAQAAAPRMRGRGPPLRTLAAQAGRMCTSWLGWNRILASERARVPSCYCPLLLLPQRNKGQRWPGVPDLKSQQQRDEGAFASSVCVCVFQRGVRVCQSRVCVCVSQSREWSTRPERGWKDRELSCVREQSSRPQSDSWAWGRQSGGQAAGGGPWAGRSSRSRPEAKAAAIVLRSWRKW